MVEELTRPLHPLLLETVHHLTRTIGPRLATSPAEADAAWWAAHHLQGWGYEVTVQPFQGGSPFRPLYPLLYGASLVAGLGAARRQRGWPALLAALAALGFWQEQHYRPLLSKILPSSASQNVVAILPPQQERRQRLILTAHLDTPLATLPLPSDIAAGERAAWIALMGAMTLIAGIALSGRGASLLPLPSAYLLGAALLGLARPRLLARSSGADDNASGVAVLLALAERLRPRLVHTELWVLLTGCGKTGSQGLLHFLDHYPLDPETTWFLNVECVGRGQVAALTSEGNLQRHEADPTLLALAQQSLTEQRLPGTMSPASAGSSDAQAAMARGFRALTVSALEYLPRYSDEPPDSLQIIESDTLQSALLLAEGITHRLDHRAGNAAPAPLPVGEVLR